MINFHPLEVVGRCSVIKLQVDEHFKKDNLELLNNIDRPTHAIKLCIR